MSGEAQRILVVEDDEAIREVIVDALEFEGYSTVACATFDVGLKRGSSVPCDLALLDVVLPDGSGFDLVPKLRECWPNLPIIMLTARGREEDRIRGLKLGADDYVVKPFSIKEMVARVEAVLRRSPARPREARSIAFPGGEVDLAGRTIRYQDGSTAELAEREADLLRYLAMHADRPVSRVELLTKVWHLPGGNTRTRTVDMHIARLREKLRDSKEAPKIITTLRGEGYQFVSS